MTAETSPAKSQSYFGSLCVNFGLKLHWDLCSGSLSPHSHHPVKASQIGPIYKSAPSYPHTKLCCAGLPGCTPSQPLWNVEECCERPFPLLWNQHKDLISLRNKELGDRHCQDPLCCSGNKFKLSSNNAPQRTQSWMYLRRNTPGFAQIVL